ncbi:MAG: MFS transporter [Chloroflexi bacterium]|nr:MFS transporter [Chloroflexota bacterium]
MPSLVTRRVFYGWWLVALTSCILAMIFLPIFQGLGAFFVALEREFGWKRAALAGAFSLSRAEDTVIGPLAGYFTDRYGTRRLVFIGFLILGIGFICFALVQTIFHFYAAFIVLTLGAGFAGFLPLMGAINKWFIRKRATAMGLAQSGVALGGILVPLLASAIDADWRLTCFVLAGVVWVMAFPVSKAIRNSPEEYGQLPDGDLHESEADTVLLTEPDLSASEAVRSTAFWVISFTHALAAVVFLTLMIHAIPMIEGKGYTVVQASFIVTTFTVVGGIFQFVGGVIGDRVSKKFGIFCFVSLQALGVLGMALADGYGALVAAAVIFGVGFGGRVPLLIAIRGDYFGREKFATIFGLSTIPMGIIQIFGPIGAGFMYDRLGSYTMAFLILFGVNMLAAMMILLVRPPREIARTL